MANKTPKRRSDDHHDHEEDDNNIVVDEQSHTIYLFGAITEEKAGNFLMALQSLDSDTDVSYPITVVLNSPGGMTYAGYTIYDAIRLAKHRVHIEGFGKIFSMAVLVLQAGDRRFMSPQAELMIHDVFVEGAGELSVKDSRRLARDLVKENKRYQKLVSQRVGMPLTKFSRLCAKETFMSAEDALKMGFVDGILKPTK